MADINLKQFDLEPPATISLVNAVGAALDLTSAVSVSFRMMDVLTHVELFMRPATVDDPASGQIMYDWQARDTGVVGAYYGEFVVEWTAGRPQSYPRDGYITIAVDFQV